MKANHIYVYLFDGYSDWELGYLMPELREDSRYKILTVSDTGTDVVSKGGLKVSVDISLEDLEIDNIRLFVIPGGQMWEENQNDFSNLDRVVYGAYTHKLPIAAICGATVYLAHRGMLDQVKHTSNALFYLKGLVSTYGGEVNYSNELAVSDANIITASGIAPLEFTKEIMKELEFNSEYVERWYQLFKYGIFPTAQ
ncbi:MAG: glutamine amidotransferase [Myroides sp.]|jgi:putative intracellular protease/amidase|uniref:type 1 glutamine amidotransferase family protein n=1 Tax=Myroides marinus TaxID=703342 RepID=UPI002576B2AD|nr:type 1 glutamine amidotransferase family protein [Myroides marinus]MDR0194309.1 glutamine amidotransferase [Myroides sp.]MDM1367549.1 glutamine amidotransferase [Myroides marinus]MDM1371784.1 glutamine amidotransferase [Myroides marinus]MDM1374764.1 glutamine amidotransferase [Myroides marinus]MDM1379522.1 glutamine amidotransferase [Myroides marinus]